VRCLSLLGLCLSLVSCGGAPDIELCQVDGDSQRLSLDCSHKDRGDYSRTAESSDGYICQSRRGTERFFQACRDRQPFLTEFCNLYAAERVLICATISGDEEIVRTLTWQEASGYICTNSSDLRRYLDWCYRG